MLSLMAIVLPLRRPCAVGGIVVYGNLVNEMDGKIRTQLVNALCDSTH